ncbi:MAG: glycoside hydrolase family 16 protein [Granulosicoccus sp.]
MTFAIEKPHNLHGTEIAQATVKWAWDPVPGAVHYEITVDGIAAGKTADTQILSHNLWGGDHSLTVKAVGADQQISSASLTAKLGVSHTYNAETTNGSYLVDANVIGTDTNIGDQNRSQLLSANDPSLVDPASWSMPEVLNKSGYDLVFSDEFNGSAINSYRWNTQLRWDGEFNGERYEYRVINGEDQFYINVDSPDQAHLDATESVYNPFEFDGSRLAIRAVRNPLKQTQGNKRFGPLRDMVAQQTFLSGAISTYDKFTQKFGYFEARIKIPNHTGSFPAFWLHHQKRAYEGTQRTEIDIMENLGHAPWYIYNSYHYNTNVSATRYGDTHSLKPQPEGQIYTGVDYSLDYHVYAAQWEPGHITWFIDGEKVSELSDASVNHEELYLILNMAMGGNWTNFPTNSGGLGRSVGDFFPTAFDLTDENFRNPALEIDYVRVYKRKP